MDHVGHGSSGTIEGTGHARANLVWEPDAKRELLDRDWRGEALTYTVPDDMRLPQMVTSDSGTGPASRCTEALCARIERLVLEGASLPAARRACGVRRNEWTRWMTKADQGREPYRQMQERMSLVMAWKEMNASRIIAAASEHPDAAIATANAEKILKWTNPAKYAATRTRTDVNVRMSGTVSVQAVHALLSAPTETLSALAVSSSEWLPAAPKVLVAPPDEDE